MFRGERPTIVGRHYTVKDAINEPAPIQEGGPPIMIGGQGEKKTLRLMAQHAEMANIIAGVDELPRKLDVLAAHCADVGRDPATINKTPLLSLFIGDSVEAAEAKRNAFLAARGMDWDALGEAGQAMVGARLVVGDADRVGEQVQRLLDMGLDGICVNLPHDAHDLDTVAAAGAASPAPSPDETRGIRDIRRVGRFAHYRRSSSEIGERWSWVARASVGCRSSRRS